MNYADLKLGTWHPKGGMYKVVEGMVELAESLGVKIQCNTSVESINTEGGHVKSVTTDKGTLACDILLSGADYVHTESLLPKKERQYSEKYWENRTFAPSALLYYVGFNKKLKNVSHAHTVF